MKCLQKCLILFLNIILLFFSITKDAYSLDSKDLIPLKRVFDLSLESDYSHSENDTLQPFEDPSSRLMGYKNKDGKIVIKPKFDRALAFSKFGIADVFLKPNKWYKIDANGKKLFQSYLFDNGPDYYARGLMRFIKNDKVGFANQYGKIIIPASFDFAMSFSSYSAPLTVVYKAPLTRAYKGRKEEQENIPNKGCQRNVIKGGKWGMINNKGETVVPIEFDSYEVLEDNTVVFLKDNYVSRIYLRKGK